MKTRKKHDNSKENAVFRPWLCATIERIHACDPEAPLITWCAGDFNPSRNRQKVRILAQKFAAFLASKHISAGQTIAVISMMRWEIPIIWLAAQMLAAAPMFFPSDMRDSDIADTMHALDASSDGKIMLITASPGEAKKWLGDARDRQILYLDETDADSIFGLPMPQNVCSFVHATELFEPYTAIARVPDDATAAVIFTQGSRKKPRRIPISYALLSAQAEEIAAAIQLDKSSKVFIDMPDILTVSLVVLAACMYAGAAFICRDENTSIANTICTAQPTHVFIRPHELSLLLAHIKKPANASRLSLRWRKTCLQFGKFRERNTNRWLKWSAPVIESACLKPVRNKYFPNVAMIISYGNHFKTKSAETLSFLDIPVRNAFTSAEIGILHIHEFKGNGGFLKSVESKIKNGILSVRQRRSSTPFINTGDLVFEDDRSGLCSRRNVTVTLSTGESVDTSPMRQILKRHGIIDEIFIFGSGRPFLSALIYLDPGALRSFAATQKIANDKFAVLAQNPVIYKHVRALVDACNITRKPVESIQKIAILPTPLDEDPRILTPCRLARLGEIQQRYKAILNGFYMENF